MAGHAEGEGGGEEYPGRMLHQAAIYDNTDFLASLLEGDEKNFVNVQDSFGRTALYTAVTNNSLECARILLEHGGKFYFPLSCCLFTRINNQNCKKISIIRNGDPPVNR